MTDATLDSAPATGRSADDKPRALPHQPEWPNLHAPDTHVIAPIVEHDRPQLIRRLRRNPSFVAGTALLLLIVAAAALAPVFYPGDPLSMVARPLLWPGQDSSFPLGSDSLGRDLAADLMHGARISLLIGFVATTIGLVVGISVGAVAGYRGGRVDDLLVRIIELFQTVPSFILLVVLVAIAQPSIVTVTWAIGLVTWPTIARLVRAEFRVLREKEFVMAARSLGFGHTRIVVREILPNALPAIIVTSSVMVATAILMEAALSFLGLGDPNAVSWGSMIGSGRELIRTAWYLTALPGLVIVMTVLSLNLIGDGLTDVLNPRLSRER
ncbi:MULTISPECIES: ABC transporter permease [Bradyrhizobium]|jgi:peptide/nickel transport system permease protein|uniref:ABC transporter permease n=1 Tax=Bradyrhizobium TaxID=374 RepID=UPI00048A1A4F|nr:MULTISPECIES: ABC transporter permease [Bradyrhizobium]MDI2054728.1 ABC transporter permease [Bradyrhizobium sp. Mp19]MDI2104558.1 ABC transporter permease [Bradyrhizobium sp. Mp64]WLA97701.1 ABC transporter permease [Bradyrhizobium elkanii]WLC10627.1 ABC transporter permease [Bradyrhizobium elkanii USDA 94]